MNTGHTPHSPAFLLVLLASVSSGSLLLHAGPQPGSDAIAEAPSPSPWFFSAGAMVRSVDAGFRLDGGKAILQWETILDPRTGRGNVGLYRGGGRVTYDDGYLEAFPWFGPGAASGFIASSSQISDHPFGEFANLNRNKTVRFHTHDHQYSESSSSSVATGTSSDTGVGPYVSLGYSLPSSGQTPFQVNLVTGWSFLSTDQSSGNRPVAGIAIDERRTRHTYRYDYIANPSFPLLIPGAVDGTNHLIISDPSVLFEGDQSYYRAPDQSSSTSRYSFAVFEAIASADLDVDLHEIPFGVEFGTPIGPFDVFLTGGATLNIINYELESSLRWYQAGVRGPVASQRWRDTGSPLKVGLYGGVTVRCPLTSGGRVFLEGSGTYRWVDPVRASAGLADVEIDVSSAEGRLGLGILF